MKKLISTMIASSFLLLHAMPTSGDVILNLGMLDQSDLSAVTGSLSIEVTETTPITAFFINLELGDSIPEAPAFSTYEGFDSTGLGFGTFIPAASGDALGVNETISAPGQLQIFATTTPTSYAEVSEIAPGTYQLGEFIIDASSAPAGSYGFTLDDVDPTVLDGRDGFLDSQFFTSGEAAGIPDSPPQPGTFNTELPFSSTGFDQLIVVAVPEPGSTAILWMVTSFVLLRRRSPGR
jgi:hypothetical protein